MDLVDIDKVLDDLELNEGTMPETVVVHPVNYNKSTTKISTIIPELSQLETATVTTTTTTTIITTTPVTTTSIITSSDIPSCSAAKNYHDFIKSDDRTKRFVAVSQVLSSLDDYCRDVEQLQETIDNHDDCSNEKILNINCDKTSFNNFYNDSNVDNELVRNNANNNDVVDDDDVDVDDDDEYEDDDGLTTASSITTSSPSSFSSGQIPNGVDGIVGSSIDSVTCSLNVSSAQPSTIQEDHESNVNDNDNVDKKNCDDETSIDVISATATSVETSTNLSTLPDVCSIIINSQKCDDNSDKVEKNLKNLKQDDDNQQQQQQQKQIVFGSTMDEISDTELDSMLQEIDIELQQNSTVQLDCQKLNSTGDEDNVEKTSHSNNCKNLSSIDDDSIHDLITNCDEKLQQQNADSFSQASTIEFTDNIAVEKISIDESSTGAEGTEICDVDDDENSTSSGGIKNDMKVSQRPDSLNLPMIQQRPDSLDLPMIQQRPDSLDLPIQQRLTELTAATNLNATAGQTPPAINHIPISPDKADAILPGNGTASSGDNLISQLGKVPPFWIPDSEANSCMQCHLKFSLLKRRHHCRACGQVLCSMCCSQKAKLTFVNDAAEVRVCVQCRMILTERTKYELDATGNPEPTNIDDDTNQTRSPNPNNPMEYCSMIPPHQQVEKQPSSQQTNQLPISVMVPVGVLKREGISRSYPRKDKNVIFSDGIRPGCDLAELDNNWSDVKSRNRKSSSRQGNNSASNNLRLSRKPICDENDSFIPKEANGLPPIYCKVKTDYEYKDVENDAKLITRLRSEMLRFAVQKNFHIYVKIVELKCCINKAIINFTTFGMHHVGQDEIVILLELNNSTYLPQDIFIHLNEIYRDADQGKPIAELGFSMPKKSNFLESREHGGFLYIRPTFQCLQEIHLPDSPFLIGILIHRWEVPWAKIFPLRLMLRLGAQYRYYPCPHISIRERDSVYAEIAQTIINFLADFRNYTYTIATIKGMYIHMEDRKTSMLIPKNRYDQIVKALNNSSDHILALAGNFSKKADGHLVCIQNMESDCPDTNSYSTQAINIQGQPRKVTGASFMVLNGALKSTSGLSGKCSIVEDGLMVQILPQKMQSIRKQLKNMTDIEIVCGPINADDSQTEIVCIKWTDNDMEFNCGVESPIDGKKMDGIPSIRVHSGFNYSNSNHLIRWTEVFILQSDEDPGASQRKDPMDISKISEQVAKSTSVALMPFLDLLATNGCVKIGLRATLHQDNVCFEAGSKSTKLAPLYMNALDNELVPVLHQQTNSLDIENPIILELILHILDK